MLNLERLRVLHAVADRGSVNAAARALHVTSSAISQQLAKLEQEVGQPLLERNGRGVRLTDAALVLVGHTARVLSALALAEAELDAQRTSVAGSLMVAAFPTAAGSRHGRCSFCSPLIRSSGSNYANRSRMCPFRC